MRALSIPPTEGIQIFKPHKGREFDECYKTAWESIANETREQIFERYCQPTGLTDDALIPICNNYGELEIESSQGEFTYEKGGFKRLIALPNYEDYIQKTFRRYGEHYPEAILYISDPGAKEQYNALVREFNANFTSMQSGNIQKFIDYYNQFGLLCRGDEFMPVEIPNAARTVTTTIESPPLHLL